MYCVDHPGTRHTWLVELIINKEVCKFIRVLKFFYFKYVPEFIHVQSTTVVLLQNKQQQQKVCDECVFFTGLIPVTIHQHSKFSEFETSHCIIHETMTGKWQDKKWPHLESI